MEFEVDLRCSQCIEGQSFYDYLLLADVSRMVILWLSPAKRYKILFLKLL